MPTSNILLPTRRSRHRIEKLVNNLVTESPDHDVTVLSDPVMVPDGEVDPIRAYLRMEAGGSISGTLFGVFQFGNVVPPTFNFPVLYSLLDFEYDGPSLSGIGMLGLSGGKVIMVRGTLSFDTNDQITKVEIKRVCGEPLVVTLPSPGYVFFNINFKFKIKCGGIISGNCCRPCRPCD